MIILNSRCFLVENLFNEMKRLHSSSNTSEFKRTMKNLLARYNKPVLSTMGFKLGNKNFIKQEVLPPELKNLIIKEEIQCIDFSKKVSYYEFKCSTGIKIKNIFDFFSYGEVMKRDGTLLKKGEKCSASNLFVLLPEPLEKAIKNNELLYFIYAERDGEKIANRTSLADYLFDYNIPFLHEKTNTTYTFGVIK